MPFLQVTGSSRSGSEILVIPAGTGIVLPPCDMGLSTVLPGKRGMAGHPLEEMLTMMAGGYKPGDGEARPAEPNSGGRKKPVPARTVPAV